MKTILIADDDSDILKPICAYLTHRNAELKKVRAEFAKVDKRQRELKQAAIDEDDHEVVFVMQEEPLGLGHAVDLAASFKTGPSVLVFGSYS